MNNLIINVDKVIKSETINTVDNTLAENMIPYSFKVSKQVSLHFTCILENMIGAALSFSKTTYAEGKLNIRLTKEAHRIRVASRDVLVNPNSYFNANLARSIYSLVQLLTIGYNSFMLPTTKTVNGGLDYLSILNKANNFYKNAAGASFFTIDDLCHDSSKYPQLSNLLLSFRSQFGLNNIVDGDIVGKNKFTNIAGIEPSLPIIFSGFVNTTKVTGIPKTWQIVTDSNQIFERMSIKNICLDEPTGVFMESYNNDLANTITSIDESIIEEEFSNLFNFKEMNEFIGTTSDAYDKMKLSLRLSYHLYKFKMIAIFIAKVPLSIGVLSHIIRGKIEIVIDKLNSYIKINDYDSFMIIYEQDFIPLITEPVVQAMNECAYDTLSPTQQDLLIIAGVLMITDYTAVHSALIKEIEIKHGINAFDFHGNPNNYWLPVGVLTEPDYHYINNTTEKMPYAFSSELVMLMISKMDTSIPILPDCSVNISQITGDIALAQNSIRGVLPMHQIQLFGLTNLSPFSVSYISKIFMPEQDSLLTCIDTTNMLHDMCLQYGNVPTSGSVVLKTGWIKDVPRYSVEKEQSGIVRRLITRSINISNPSSLYAVYNELNSSQIGAGLSYLFYTISASFAEGRTNATAAELLRDFDDHLTGYAATKSFQPDKSKFLRNKYPVETRVASNLIAGVTGTRKSSLMSDLLILFMTGDVSKCPTIQAITLGKTKPDSFAEFQSQLYNVREKNLRHHCIVHVRANEPPSDLSELIEEFSKKDNGCSYLFLQAREIDTDIIPAIKSKLNGVKGIKSASIIIDSMTDFVYAMPKNSIDPTGAGMVAGAIRWIIRNEMVILSTLSTSFPIPCDLFGILNSPVDFNALYNGLSVLTGGASSAILLAAKDPSSTNSPSFVQASIEQFRYANTSANLTLGAGISRYQDRFTQNKI